MNKSLLFVCILNPFFWLARSCDGLPLAHRMWAIKKAYLPRIVGGLGRPNQSTRKAHRHGVHFSAALIVECPNFLQTALQTQVIICNFSGPSPTPHRVCTPLLLGQKNSVNRIKMGKFHKEMDHPGIGRRAEAFPFPRGKGNGEIWARKWWKRRSSIEPVIGHVKSSRPRPITTSGCFGRASPFFCAPGSMPCVSFLPPHAPGGLT